MKTEQASEMSERKRKFVEAYKSFAKKKLEEINDLVKKHNNIYETSGVGELWEEANRERLEEIKCQLSRKKQDYEAAKRRVHLLNGDAGFSRYTPRFDWDATDKENRSAIQDMAMEYKGAMQPVCILRLHGDSVGDKLLNIAYEAQEKILNGEDEKREYVPRIGTVVNSPHLQIEHNAWNNISKMLDRTMSEREYQHFARATPMQLKREWARKK
jgi:hypothetical protein